MNVSELAELMAVLRPAQPPRPDYLDPRKVLVIVGAAACSFVWFNLNSKVDQGLDSINKLTEISNRLVLLQEGDNKEFEKSAQWMASVDVDRKQNAVRFENIEGRLTKLEGHHGDGKSN